MSDHIQTDSAACNKLYQRTPPDTGMDTQFHQIIFPLILQAEDYAILSVQYILKNGFHATKSLRHNNSERKGTFLSEIIYPYFFFLFLYISKYSSVIYPKWLSEFLIRGTQERITNSSILRIHMHKTAPKSLKLFFIVFT